MNNYTWQKITRRGLAPYAEQDDFKIDYLPQIKKYSGLQYFDKTPDWEQLCFSNLKIILKLKNLVLILIVYLK
jgi:hypothetical protein